MSRTSFELGGFDELRKNLEALNNELQTKAGQQATRKAAQHVAKAIRSNAPRGDDDTSRTYGTANGSVTVDYGHLKDAKNIGARKGKPKDRRNITYIISTGKAFWGNFLEFGTRKMSAKPFFKPAMDASMPTAIDVMKVELKKAIEKARSGGFNKKRK